MPNSDLAEGGDGADGGGSADREPREVDAREGVGSNVINRVGAVCSQAFKRRRVEA